MAYKNARYGIPPEEVTRLGTRFFKYHLATGFGTFDNFLKFCAECGYTSHMHICKRNPDEPHSPENSYFQKTKPQYVKPKPVERNGYFFDDVKNALAQNNILWYGERKDNE